MIKILSNPNGWTIADLQELLIKTRTNHNATNAKYKNQA